MAETLDWVPEEWTGLFKVLSRKQSSVPAMEKWYTEASGSSYAQTLSWSALCSALTFQQPQVLDHKLVFTPRILHLPVKQQQDVLCFLAAHQDHLPPSAITALCDSLDRVQDRWIQATLTRLRGRETGEWTVHASNRRQYNDLIASLHATSKHHASIWNWTAACNAQNTDMDDIMCSSQPPVPVDVSTPQLKLPSQATPLSKVTPLSQHLGTPRATKRKLATTDGGGHVCASQCKIPASQTQSTAAESSCLDASVSASQDMDDAKLEALGRQLIESWEGRDALTPDTEALCRITLKQLSMVCRGFHQLSDVGVTAACQHMVSVAPHTPHSHALCFATHTLTPKLLGLSQTCSRSLLHGFLLYCRAFSRASIEAVLLPAMRDHAFCGWKADLVTKVVKEGLEATLKEELLKQICAECETWGEPLLLVLQSLLDAKLRLEEASIAALVTCLDIHSASFSSNLKFGKLLLAFINKYPKQILPSHHPALHSAVTQHSSFLRKSLTAALSKLTNSQQLL